MARNKEDFKFEIKEEISVLSERNQKGWRKECNLVSWNGKEPVYDIRQWNEDHTEMSKGITLTYDELAILAVDLSDRGFC